MKNSMIQKAKLWLFLITFAGFFNAANAGISIAPELQNLLNEANAVNTQLTAVTFTEDNVCNDLLKSKEYTSRLDLVKSTSSGTFICNIYVAHIDLIK